MPINKFAAIVLFCVMQSLTSAKADTNRAVDVYELKLLSITPKKPLPTSRELRIDVADVTLFWDYIKPNEEVINFDKRQMRPLWHEHDSATFRLDSYETADNGGISEHIQQKIDLSQKNFQRCSENSKDFFPQCAYETVENKLFSVKFLYIKTGDLY